MPTVAAGATPRRHQGSHVTSTGVAESIVVPSPSRPYSFSPQQRNTAFCTPHVWSRPTDRPVHRGHGPASRCRHLAVSKLPAVVGTPATRFPADLRGTVWSPPHTWCPVPAGTSAGSVLRSCWIPSWPSIAPHHRGPRLRHRDCRRHDFRPCSAGSTAPARDYLESCDHQAAPKRCNPRNAGRCPGAHRCAGSRR